jgi:hypothetical protein
MTIGQLFENIPTHLAVDDITVLTATASNLASSFASEITLSGSSAVEFVLDNGTDVGQLKVIYKTDSSSAQAEVTVSSWGYSADTTDQIILDAQGEAVVCIWNGTNWFPVSSLGATLS